MPHFPSFRKRGATRAVVPRLLLVFFSASFLRVCLDQCFHVSGDLCSSSLQIQGTGRQIHGEQNSSNLTSDDNARLFVGHLQAATWTLWILPRFRYSCLLVSLVVAPRRRPKLLLTLFRDRTCIERNVRSPSSGGAGSIMNFPCRISMARSSKFVPTR